MADTPLLPLPGTFHEVSVAVPDVRASVEFYERLGFTQAPTTDSFTHPYGVLTDGRLFIGVHQRTGPTPTLTFVRPGLAASLAAYAAAGIELTSCRMGEDVFNEIAFADPSGHAVAVLEARTYSPIAPDAAGNSLCGEFAEVSLPVKDFVAAQAFWETLGFVATEEVRAPYRHLALTSDHLDLAFHDPHLCPQPMLVFREPGMVARIARLREVGVTVGSAPGSAASPRDALLQSPEGTALLLLDYPA